jgi:hypothetical protein
LYGLPRCDIFIWAAIILFSNELFGLIRGVSSASIEGLVIDLCAVGIFQYMAWYVVFRLLCSSDRALVARWRDLLIATGLCLLVFLPTNRMIWVVATGIAVYLWIFNQDDLKLRAAGTVLAALSVQEFWGRVFFNLVSFPLLHAETAVVGTLLRATRAGTVWEDNMITGPNGYGLLMYSGCSSFHNLSLAFLCWVTVASLRRQNWRGRDFLIGCTVGGAMIILNVARLYLMALDIDLYNYWHHGIGAEIFAVGASVIILILSLYGSRPVGQPT